MHAIDFLRTHALSLSTLAKFAFIMAMLVGVPRLARWLRLPVAVGLLLSGVLVGHTGWISLAKIGRSRTFLPNLASFF